MKRFQEVFGVITVLFLGNSAWGAGLICGGTDTKYQVTIDAAHQEGQVTRGSSPVPFGKLQCSDTDGRGDARIVLLCRSKDVADAGFNAIVEESGSELRVNLSEVWFGGIRHLETLSCREQD